MLTYGHGDVVRGQDGQWREGLSPWKIVVEGDRMYGRGTQDDKGPLLAALFARLGDAGLDATPLKGQISWLAALL